VLTNSHQIRYEKRFWPVRLADYVLAKATSGIDLSRVTDSHSFIQR